MRLYDFLPSGNCYKVRLLLTQLGISFQSVPINILQGESRTPEFLAKNPNGRVPVLEVALGRYLAESNAILLYLSEGTDFLPVDAWERAQVWQWLFFEQYSHEPYIATSRYWISILQRAEDYADAIAQKRAPGLAALSLINDRLSQHPFMVGNRYTIADICLYAYTHVADEGGFELSAFPAIQAWIQRIQSQPRHIPITKLPPS